LLKFTTKTCHQRQQTPPKSVILHTQHKMPKHNNKHHPKKNESSKKSNHTETQKHMINQINDT